MNRGVTLIELVVTLALLGVFVGLIGLTLRTTPRLKALDTLTIQVLAVRDSALRSGHPVSRIIARPIEAGGPLDVTALPDGRVLTTDNVTVDRLTGAVLDESVHATAR